MTTELLQRIATCAPPEMGAEFYTGRSSNTPSRVAFNNVLWKAPDCRLETVVALVATDEPYINSQGCEAMLDAMEQAGFYRSITRVSGDQYDVSTIQGATLSRGPTRAIAVGEAFCQVFEGLR